MGPIRAYEERLPIPSPRRTGATAPRHTSAGDYFPANVNEGTMNPTDHSYPARLSTDTMQRLPRVTRRLMLPLMLVLGAALLWVQAGAARADDDSVLRATLDNGLQVVIIRNPLAPVVTTEINYLAGSNEAPKGFPGMAHAMEHMMFRGSPGLSADQLVNISAAMGGTFDASTEQTATHYYFTVPAEDLDVALHIEAVRMRGILASDKQWKDERGAIEQEVSQDLSNPQYVLYTKLLKALFGGTPYATDALGTRPSFDKTTGKMLRAFHDHWYVPNNAILVIAGDVQPKDALAKVKELFGAIPKKTLPERKPVNLQPVKPRTLKSNTDLPYGLVVLAYRMPGFNSADYAAAEILSDVLSSQRADLYALVPAGKALFAGFDLHAFGHTGLGAAAAAFPAGADHEALLKDVRDILKKTLKDGVSPELVKAAKRNEVAGAEFQKNSVAGLATSWSGALSVMGFDSPQQIVDAIKAVTVDDVNRVARKYLDMNHVITAVLTPEPSGKPTSSKSFGGSESFSSSATKNVKLPKWAEKAVMRLAVPDSTVDPVVTTLPNGIKLIVQPESVSNTVSVYGGIKTNPDLQTPKDQDGVHQVLDELFSYGTTSLDRLAFQKALDDIAAGESAGTSFSLQVLSDRFERGVELLADNELHPALPELAFKITRKQIAETVKGQLKSPGFLTGQALHKGLYPKDDPVLRYATPETVSGLTLDQVKDYYQDVFRPDMTTIVVIGDVTPDGAKKVIEKYFGKWKAHGPQPETDYAPVPPNKPSATVVPNTSRVQDSVVLAETVDVTITDPDYYTLELGNHVLGGAFYATRLYRDLRKDTGLVYFVSSSFQVGKTRGTYMVNYGCDPPNVSKARSIVERDLKQMQTEPVTDEELHRAKALLLRKIPLSESSLDSIAGGLLSRSLLDLPLDTPIRAAKIYINLTAKDIQDAFAKYIRPADFVQVTQGPAP
jgi:zinc protease